MSAMSDWLEDQLIDHIFRTTSMTKPTVLAICLLTTGAIDADTGQFTTGTGVEVANAFAYARQTNNPLDANWAAPSAGNGQTSNVNDITFPAASGGSWGTITHAAITNNATFDSGDLLFHGNLNVAKVISDTDVFEFSANELKVTLA